MFRLLDGRTEFYQWDINQKLIVEDASVTEVHFCNRTDDCSLVCEVVDGQVNVPNVLLTEDWPIRVYAYCCNGDSEYTKVEEHFKVNRRSKPESYVYEETEIMTWNALEQRIAAIEETPPSGMTPAQVEQLDRATADIQGIEDALGEYALKDEIPSTVGLATESYVDEKFNSIEVPEVDLSNYYTMDQVEEYVDIVVDNDLSGYYTKSEVDTAISNALAAIGVAEQGAY